MTFQQNCLMAPVQSSETVCNLCIEKFWAKSVCLFLLLLRLLKTNVDCYSNPRGKCPLPPDWKWGKQIRLITPVQVCLFITQKFPWKQKTASVPNQKQVKHSKWSGLIWSLSHVTSRRGRGSGLLANTGRNIEQREGYNKACLWVTFRTAKKVAHRGWFMTDALGC